MNKPDLFDCFIRMKSQSICSANETQFSFHQAINEVHHGLDDSCSYTQNYLYIHHNQKVAFFSRPYVHIILIDISPLCEESMYAL